MDYKKIIRNQRTRFFILKLLRWVPSNLMVRIQYFIKQGRLLHLKHPRRFTEKIQHYKLYYRNIELRECVDKYLVRQFVARRGCGAYLNELFGVYTSFQEIPFQSLPDQFVAKTTDGGGGENILIVRQKSTLDLVETEERLNAWKSKDVQSMTREWAYGSKESAKIIIEKYLEDPLNDDRSIDDYKFFCFDGKVEYLVVDVDRYSGHKRNFYDKSWNNCYVSSDCPQADRELKKPAGFEEMKLVAERLSAGFPFVRVDLYYFNGKVVFGEMTFYPWSGYVQFHPDEFDLELGKYFSINYGETN